MNLLKRFLLIFLCAFPTFAGAQVATTAGSNLTAWNGNSGATNNNNWNQLMNNRTLATGGAAGAAPTADFGNCNALILRCAQPKCSGCTTLEIARPIVQGCVNSNESCKKYGDDLVEFISAQMVSNVVNKAQQAEIAAQNAAAQQAAAQNTAQMQQMQQQMAQMQYEMQQQNAQQMAQMQAALDEQKALTQQALADNAAARSAQSSVDVSGGASSATLPSGNGALTDAQIAAAEQGVSADILARQQISGQIMSKIEGAEVALKSLKATMNTAFEYAGCDSSGNNCVGPKRAKVFKQKALAFFDPYNDVLDELYDALITAQAVGVDITDIYMMLNGSCNVWGEYLCSDTTREEYNDDNCKSGKSVRSGTTNGGHECYAGQVVPAEDSPACVLQRTLADQEEVQRNWLYAETGDRDDMIRVGCASAALETSTFFRNRKKQATIDIETLERIIEQDAPAMLNNRFTNAVGKVNPDLTKYCMVNGNTYSSLQKAASTKTLPKKICVSDDDMESIAISGVPLATNVTGSVVSNAKKQKCRYEKGVARLECLCNESGDGYFNTDSKRCVCYNDGETFDADLVRCLSADEKAAATAEVKQLEKNCRDSGGAWSNSDCDCPSDKYEDYLTTDGRCVEKSEEAKWCEKEANGKWTSGVCMCGDKFMSKAFKDTCKNGQVVSGLNLPWKK